MRKFTRISIFCLLLLFSTGAIYAQNTLIKGTVEYHEDWGIEDAKLYLIDVNTNTIVDSTKADSLGNYAFDSIAIGAYVVVSETDLASGGVDLADALRIIYHLSPNVPYTLDSAGALAADVDGDDSISFVDAHTILSHWASEVVYGVQFDFTVGDWVFDAGFDKDTFYVTQSTDTITYTISGSSTGDVNGSYVPKLKPSPDILITPGMNMRTNAEGMVNIPISFDCPLTAGAAGLIFSYSTAMLEISDISTPHEGLFYEIVGNKIYMLWFNDNATPLLASSGDLFFTIHGKLKPGFVQRSINIEIEDGSHIVDQSGKLIRHPVISIPSIEIDENKALIGNIYPNPVNNVCTISLAIPSEGQLEIDLYDIRGVLVDNLLIQHVEAGQSELSLNLSEYDKGMYMIKAIFNGSSILEENTKVLISR